MSLRLSTSPSISPFFGWWLFVALQFCFPWFTTELENAWASLRQDGDLPGVTEGRVT